VSQADGIQPHMRAGCLRTMRADTHAVVAHGDILRFILDRHHSSRVRPRDHPNTHIFSQPLFS
jgi:hypothetical protein